MAAVVLVVGKEHEAVFPSGLTCAFGILDSFVNYILCLGDVDHGYSAYGNGEFVGARIGSRPVAKHGGDVVGAIAVVVG